MKDMTYWYSKVKGTSYLALYCTAWQRFPLYTQEYKIAGWEYKYGLYLLDLTSVLPNESMCNSYNKTLTGDPDVRPPCEHHLKNMDS